MTHYDYRVIPAPRKLKKVKGVSGAEELFALTLTEAINEVARQGWEYVRAERLPAEAPRGWLKPAVAEEQAVLVFRRWRESLGPASPRCAPSRPVWARGRAAAGARGAAPRPARGAGGGEPDEVALPARRAVAELRRGGRNDGTPPPRLGPAEKI